LLPASELLLHLWGFQLNATFRLALIAIFTFVGFVIIGPTNTKAIPAFARKYGLSCGACHTSPPRLNETGYRFRAAGFRWPEAIGSKEHDERFDIFDYMSARLQVRYTATRSKTDPEPATTSDEIKLQAFELYPFAGSFGKYLSADTKVTFGSDGAPSIENAYVKANVGNEKRFFSSRVGIFHPYDGYGASDSPATISRPFIQTIPSNLNAPTFFTTWGFDQLGWETGFDYKRTSIRATLANGIVLSNEDGRLKASAAQGGALTAQSISPPTNSSDFQVFANQIINPEGGGLSFHYYHGNLNLPVMNSGFFLNSFDRVALYGSYPANKRLQLFGGVQWGRDHLPMGATFGSNGGFVEVAVPIKLLSAAGVRFDWFDPANGKQNDQVKGFTAYVNAWFYSQFRVVAEYQHKNIERAVAVEEHDDTLQIRLIYIK
jgi:hypothetical protein